MQSKPVIEPSPFRIGARIVYEEPEISNHEFAKTDGGFKAACNRAKEAGHNVEPCARQASKWRAGKGIAFKKFRR